ncbi:MAG: flagellar motor protein [Pseudomonadales bacterium]
MRVDLLAIFGVLLGIVTIVSGHALEGGTISMLLDTPAALIVIGGTVGAIILQTPKAQLSRAVALARWVFRPPDSTLHGAVDRMVAWAKKSRKVGLISLEREMESQPDAFVRKGLALIIDGGDPVSVRRAMEIDVSSALDSDLAAAAVFRNMGGYAPTIGIIGAVLGLMQVMSNLADPAELGPGIATAFVATIYGVGLANLLLLPIADRIRALVIKQSQEKLLWLEGLMAIAEGEHPSAMKMRLSALAQP